jgi:hypothetical protein
MKHYHVTSITLSTGKSPISTPLLAKMLGLEALCGHEAVLLCTLQQALDDAFAQGVQAGLTTL